ncbi:phosphatidate cytidylyltransferase [Entomoplasma ellychniae]|uniref:Phosphatidate cytidylyltransferase n=1 Tax=Entomoplasma ellychniae TaxID=2114 RepID=A0A8E2QYS4_9MOLU|nr:phosphatidate cytidylyltransferase [Entomoplasma ellychniae]PPE05075.1 phosphatidate cytidylyltransferase [Entomoplasma ellychniae]
MHSIKDFKIKNNNLFLRVISGAALFWIFGLYVAFAVLNNELWVQQGSKNLSYVFGWLFIIASIAILAATFVELFNTFKLKKVWAKFFLIIFGTLLYLMPLGDAAFLADGIFIYNFHKAAIIFFGNPFFQFAVFFTLIGAMFFVLKIINYKTLDALWIVFIGLVIVFGLKGFTTICLSVDYTDKNGYSAINMGYITGVWIWIGIILTDTFAYFFGGKFGKHKMAPKISPKKSWEGAIGGFLSSTIILISLSVMLLLIKSDYNVFNVFVFAEILSQSQIITLYVLFAVLISITCQFGDLFFSFIKRKMGIKDFSNIIPGHGGILDRLDSFMVVFSLMFFIILIDSFIG